MWLKAKGHVMKWQILSFSFCEKEQAAFAEWDFACVADDAKYALLGISKVNIKDDKISHIHEYRMTHKPYHWNGKGLVSE